MTELCVNTEDEVLGLMHNKCVRHETETSKAIVELYALNTVSMSCPSLRDDFQESVCQGT